MRSQVTKWGNSLAVRIPADYARTVGLREGDSVELETTAAGQITLTPQRQFDKGNFLARLARLRKGVDLQTEAAGKLVRKLRDEERY